MRIPRFAYLIPFWLLLLFLSYTVRAERLPLRSYTVADGLASNQITKIVCDSRGFLWFCTAEGLSRFDGYQFINYSTKDGLPHTVVNDLLETHSGQYWIATNAGLMRFNPGSQPADKIVYANGFAVPVGIIGVVPTKVSTENGPISVGDLLVTARVPGYAMRRGHRSKCVGATLGKAMEPLLHGHGTIKVLVMLK